MANYLCVKCKKTYDNVPAKPKCDETPQCKNGLFVNEVKTQASQAVTLAVPAHYEIDSQREVYKGINMQSPSSRNHRPSGPVYIHQDGQFAISADGSTHDGGQGAWKGFQLTSKGWIYLGSFDAALNHVDRGGTSLVENLPN